MVQSHYVENSRRLRELERDLFNRDDFIDNLKQERTLHVKAEISSSRSRGYTVTAAAAAADYDSSALKYSSPYAILQDDTGDGVDKLILNFKFDECKGIYDDCQDSSSLDSLCYSLSSDCTDTAEGLDNIGVSGHIEDVDDYLQVFDKPDTSIFKASVAASVHHSNNNRNFLHTGKDNNTMNSNGGLVEDEDLSSRVVAVADLDNDILFGDSIIASDLEMNNYNYNYNSPLNRDMNPLPHQQSCNKRKLPVHSPTFSSVNENMGLETSENISQQSNSPYHSSTANIGKKNVRKRKRGEHNDYQRILLEHLYSLIPKNKYPEGSLLRAFNNKKYREDLSTINSPRAIDTAYRKWRKEEANQRRLLRIQKRRKNKGYTLKMEDEEDEDDDYVHEVYNI
jgi:hypothetical protein